MVSITNTGHIVVYNGLFENEDRFQFRKEFMADQRAESAVCFLGVEYTYEEFHSEAPFRVLVRGHWAVAGTGLEHGGPFGEHGLLGRCIST